MNIKKDLEGDGYTAMLSPSEIERLNGGDRVSGCHKALAITVRRESESPLDYLERTWNEPRFDESPAQHFHRINGGAN